MLEASADLYAAPVGTFRQVTLPLSAPGVVTGCMLVFILLMGEYLIPALLGGGKVFFVGNALVDLFLQSRNWPFGAACAVALVAIMLVTVTLYMRVTLSSRHHARPVVDLSVMRILRTYASLVYPLPLRADRHHRRVQLQRRAQRQRLPRLLAAMVREGRRQPLRADALATQPDRRRHLVRPGDRVRHRRGAGAATHPGALSRHVRRADLCRHHGAGHRHRHRDADRAGHRLRGAEPDAGRPLAGRSGGRAAAPLGYGSVIPAHSLFAMALVIIIVRARLLGMDRSLIEASADLYATPWGTFRQVTLPQILPAIIAGFLLSFTFSLDDYVIASFVAGPTVTLPIYVFASIRRGVTPEINAIGTVVLSVSLLLLFGSLLLLRRGQRAGAATSKA